MEEIPVERKVQEVPMRIPRGHIRCRRPTLPTDSCVPPVPQLTRRKQPSTAIWVTVEALHRARSARQGPIVVRWTTMDWQWRWGTDCRRGGLAAYMTASLPAAAVTIRHCSSLLPLPFCRQQHPQNCNDCVVNKPQICTGVRPPNSYDAIFPSLLPSPLTEVRGNNPCRNLRGKWELKMLVGEL